MEKKKNTDSLFEKYYLFGRQRGVGLEGLLVYEMLLAFQSDPLEKIRHICEAIFALDEDRREKIGIDEESFEEIVKIYVLCNTFQSVLALNSKAYIRIPWPFDREHAELYLNFLEDMKPILDYHSDKKLDNFIDKIYYGKLHPISILSIINYFIGYAILVIMPIAAKLMTLISRPIFLAFTGKGREVEAIS